MRRFSVFMGLLGLAGAGLPLVSRAATECESNFTVSGDPRNGAGYMTHITIPNLDVRSALGQLQQQAVNAGMEVGTAQIEGDEGTQTYISKDGLFKKNGMAMMVLANRKNGQVGVAVQLQQGQTASDDAMRGNMCRLLASIHMDAAGAAVAEQALAKTNTGDVVDIKATDLSKELIVATRKNHGNAELVAVQYINRKYRIDGQISRPSDGTFAPAFEARDAANGRPLSMIFDTQARAGIFGIGEKGQMLVTVQCYIPASQYQRLASLRSGNYATVVGTVTSFDGSNLILDCHFEK